MKRLEELLDRTPAAPAVADRRGPARQRRRREREQRLRGHVVDFSRWTRTQGWAAQGIAELLQLAPRTLRQWCWDRRHLRPEPPSLGRPVRRAAVAQRDAVIALLDAVGPRLGLPTLQSCFPQLARAELADLLARYRRLWRQRHQQALHVLDWPIAGSVWALDYAEAPQPIDGIYPYLLGLRDLASGAQLLWRPLRAATAAEALVALAPLLIAHGPPLVLKTDNGAPFGTDAFRALLAAWSVLLLYSPPYTPRSNGAIEAGIGSLKSRTDEHASRAGRPGSWSWDDVEAARLQANATACRDGRRGPTPDALWQAREPITVEARARFTATVDRERPRARAEGGLSLEGALLEPEQRAVDRVAIRRALEEHGFLLYARRRTPLPFPARKAAGIR
jgi:transposase InsO family protein